jgi:hypothetical protein
MTQAINITNTVEQINDLLLEGEPNNISEDTYNHYTGYTPQAIFDAMNTVLGVAKWGFEEVSMKPDSETDPKIVVCCVRVWLDEPNCNRSAYGQARITKGDLGDAYKGAQTDAIKKALSYFSIGNRAYLGLLMKRKKDLPSVPPIGTPAAGAMTNGNGVKLATPGQVKFIGNLLKQKGHTEAELYTKYNVQAIAQLPIAKASEVIDNLNLLPDVT